MIPYIKSESVIQNKTNTITCNSDLVILKNSTLILLSLVDINIKNRKVISDLISDKFGTKVFVKDYENANFNLHLQSFGLKFKYKQDKQDKLTHSVIYSDKINNYIINWNNDDLPTLFCNYLNTKHFLPITKEIVESVMSRYVIYEELTVYTRNPMFENLKCYEFDLNLFKSSISKINLSFDDTFDWTKIETMEDYIFSFLQPIKEKINENISILYDKNKIEQEMFNGKYKPFSGQVPVIQGAIEVLNRSRVVYLGAEQGMGKTLMASKINHCYFKNSNYITLAVVPAITLNQWKEELENSIADKLNIFIIKSTIDFIKIYNKTKLIFDKPTYFLVGKETFKLDAKKKPGIIKIRNIVCCPDCGSPIKHPKTSEILTEYDFMGTPKKSNYSCYNCNSILWQNTYDKTKKTSLIKFIKVKNIYFDSVIQDEIHQSNNSNSIIGNASRTLINYAKKIILLSGTSNSGYASNFHNILLGLFSNKLKKNDVIDIKEFIKTYGTLQAITKVEDGGYYKTGRTLVKESEFREIEGVNPILFTKYLAENYIFATLSDLEKNLPELNEYYLPVLHDNVMERNENHLVNTIRDAIPYNAKMYNATIVAHYTNNPCGWNEIIIPVKDGVEKIQPINYENVILQKEHELIKLLKKEVLENRKCCVYTDFTGNGSLYMKAESVPERILKLLEKEGIRGFWLKPNVPPVDRKEIILKNKDNFDVLITNPKLVEVGINLQFIPTYIVFNPSYKISTIEQAIRRGYRVNSVLENRIYYLYYKNSVENDILERMRLKKAESKAIESKFDDAEVVRTASALGSKLAKNLK